MISAPPTYWGNRTGTYPDVLRFVVNGSGLENVELVSANDPSIVYARFTISADKTVATGSYSASSYYSSYRFRILEQVRGKWDEAHAKTQSNRKSPIQKLLDWKPNLPKTVEAKLVQRLEL